MLIKEVLDCITFRQMGFETKEDYNRDEEVILLQDYLNEQDSFLEEPNKIA